MTATTRTLAMPVWTDVAARVDESDRAVGSEGDRALLVRARAGDGKACRELIDRHGGRLLQIVRATHADLGIAEDIVQEAFMRALSQAEQLREEASMFPWLVRIAIRVGLDYRRKVRRETLTDVIGDVPAEREASPDQRFAQSEDSERVRGALEKLKPYQRQLMIARYFGSLSVAELSHAFGKSEPAIRKDLQRTRERVRALLGDFFEE